MEIIDYQNLLTKKEDEIATLQEKVAAMEVEVDGLKCVMEAEYKRAEQAEAERDAAEKKLATIKETLKTLIKEAEPVFNIYNEDYEEHEMPLNYPSPDGIFIALNDCKNALKEVK